MEGVQIRKGLTCAWREAFPSGGSAWGPGPRSAAGTGAPPPAPPARGSRAPPSLACQIYPEIAKYIQNQISIFSIKCKYPV